MYPGQQFRLFLIREGLTNRELEVSKAVCQGMNSLQVGILLFVTEKTIKFHLTNIFRKLRIKNRKQLITLCATHGGLNDDKNNKTRLQSTGNLQENFHKGNLEGPRI